MRNPIKRIALLAILFICFIQLSSAQRNKETNLFDNFQYDNSGKSNINAYLLAYLNYKMTPQNLLGVPSNAAEAKSLSRNNSEFEIEFKTRMTKLFVPKNAPTAQSKPRPQTTRPQTTRPIKIKPNILKNIKVKPLNSAPVIEFFYESDGNGYDPEVMLISTPKYIILAWRGTDRVSSSRSPFKYNFGEWEHTNFDAALQYAPYSIPGQVHRGFDQSIRYGNLIGKLARRLKQLQVTKKKLWITGHSLGGAHAQLAAAYLKKGYNISTFCVYAYAPPGVGDARFAGYLNRILPGSRLQRFIYILDPVPRLPWVGIHREYRRAGQLNYYSQEEGQGNYFYNTREKNDVPGPFLCQHHTNWYARAAFFELIDHAPSYSSKVPNAPREPSEFCGPIDKQMAEGHSNVIQSFFGIDQDMESGTYYIINARTNKYLNVSQRDINTKGKPLHQSAQSNRARFKWIVQPVDGVLGGYTIKCKAGHKIIDADRLTVGQHNSKVQIWDRIPLIRTHQEWEIERQNNGRYRINNILNRKYRLKGLDNGRVVLNNSGGASSEWFFVKVSN